MIFKIENSPEYEAKMEEYRQERERLSAEKAWSDARKEWLEAGSTWMPMECCPFSALSEQYGVDGTILVSDGLARALVTVSKRFGRPMFFKTQPEQIFRDGMMHLVGGEVDPREDLPSWWWEWELTDEHGLMTYAGGEETGKEEVDFVPTAWTFLPDPPPPPPRRMSGDE